MFKQVASEEGLPKSDDEYEEEPLEDDFDDLNFDEEYTPDNDLDHEEPDDFYDEDDDFDEDDEF